MGEHRGQPKGRLSRFGLSRAGRIILASAAIAVVAGIFTTASVAAYNLGNNTAPAVGTHVSATPAPSDFIRPRLAMPATPQPLAVRTYVVRQGDSLWKIAHDKLGDGSRWNQIALNNDIPAPYTLVVGEVLTL